MRAAFLLLPALAFALAACEPAEQNVAGGAVAGAILGAALSSKSDRTKGAILGAGAGVAAAAVVNETGGGRQQCNYRDAYGQVYQAPC